MTIFGSGTGRTFSALVAPAVGSTPASRLAGLPEVPWVRPDDVEIAGSTADFLNEAWNAYISVHADGTHLVDGRGGIVVGAGTLHGAATNDSSCEGWTRSDAGQCFESGAFGEWNSKISNGFGPCDTGWVLRLYCFESTPP